MTEAPGLADDDRRDRLRLARSDGVGPVTYRELMRRYRSARRALEALPELARRGGRSAPLRIVSVAEAEAEIAAGEALGATLITLGEPTFPANLAAVDPAPPLIWTRGRSELTTRPCVAIVGARVASAGGQSFARQLAHDCGAAGLAVVSGLARGIDGAAHAGSLDTGTIAVLGGGVDDIYPAEHAALYRRIAAQGCLVSENVVGRRARAQDFPRRNRIISGLSLAVVVVEAELRSGSLITARMANEQGREVLAVPGSPLDPRSKGANDLIRNGAQLCEGAEDVLAAIREMRGVQSPPPFRFHNARPSGDGDGDGDGYGDGDDEGGGLRARVLELLSPTPVACDQIVRALDAPAASVLAALMELTLAGRAELLPGGRAARV